MAEPAKFGTRRPAAESAESMATHGCVRCGAQIALTEAMCDRCNPLGLRQPAASQVHGTVFVGIVLFVALLALLARLTVAGIGPFSGTVDQVAPGELGLQVTLTVANLGTRSGSTTCRVYDPQEGRFGPQTAYVLSPQIEAGATLTFTRQVTTLGRDLRALLADCSG